MNNQDYEFQDILMSLGENRPTAIILAYMRNHATAKSTEIEHDTGLRQPEVSTSMALLEKRGWIKVTTKPRTGKGRPYNVFTMAVSMNEIAETYQRQVEKNAEKQMKSIQKLKR